MSVHREWPWGLAMWADVEGSEPLPNALDGTGVAAGSTAIVAGVLHAVDGAATAQLWVGEPPTTLLCIYDDSFELPSGRIAISDAAKEETEEAALPIGKYRARLCVDDARFPGLAALYLSSTA